MTDQGLDERMMRRDKLTCLREWVDGATILCQFSRWGKPVPEACDAQRLAKVLVAISLSFTRVLVVLCKEVNNQIFHHWVPCAKVVSFVGWMDGG